MPACEDIHRRHNRCKERRGEGGRGDSLLVVMHGRSRMTIAPHIPTLPGQSINDQAAFARIKREAPLGVRRLT